MSMKESACMVPNTSLQLSLLHKDLATHATVHHLYMMIDVVHIVPSFDFLPSQILQ